MKGFYMPHNNHDEVTTKATTKQHATSPLKLETKKTVDIFQNPLNDLELTASIKPNIILKTKISKDSCDEIILVNGDIVKAKVLKIGVTEVDYKACDNISGPTISILKSDIFMIKHPNGTKTVMGNTNAGVSHVNNNSNNNSSTEQKVNGNSIVALCCGVGALIGFFILSIPAAIIGIIYGKRAKKEIKESPNKYAPESHGMAKAGIICAIVGLALWTLIIIILL